MRLFLSSQDFGKYGHVAKELCGDNTKAAFIKNAQDDKSDEERNFSTPQKKLMFEQLGFVFEEIDLRAYFGKTQQLREKLLEFGSVWCAGGNTYILRRAMKASGLDEILKEFIADDRIVYGGWSAGACITAQSLHGMERGDRPSPEAVPPEYPIKETLWDGLGFVDFSIIPHCNMDWFVDAAKATEVNYIQKDIPYIKLNDGDVVVVVNGIVKEYR